MISGKEAQNSQNYWGQVAIGKQLRGNADYVQGVKPIGIGKHKGVKLLPNYGCVQ